MRMSLLIVLFSSFFQFWTVTGQVTAMDISNAAWEIYSNREYNAAQDRTIFSYRISAYNNGKVQSFTAGIPSCPEIVTLSSVPYRRDPVSGLRGLMYANDVNPGRSWTYTVVLQGMIDSGEIDYSIEGTRFSGIHAENIHHEYSRGRVLGPKCQTIPKVVCDIGQPHYVGKCVGDTVRVSLTSKSKYYTRLKWSTGYPGCSFSQVDTATPFITFHGPICETEFELKLEVWGPNHQYETCSTIVTATDNNPPTFGGVYGPQDITSSCDDIPSPLHIVAKDDCDNDVAVNFHETEEEVEYGEYRIFRKWIAEDDCDNKATYEQVVVVADKEPPRLIGVPPDAKFDCAVDVEPCIVTAVDNCDDVTVDASQEIFEGSCVDSWRIVRSWFAEDSSHNGVRAYQTVEVVDVSKPEIVGIPDSTTVECHNVPDDIQPTAHDNCQDYVAVTRQESRSPGTCVFHYTLQRKYYAVDECGNHAEATWNVVVKDETKPKLSEINIQSLNVECDDIPVPCVVEATDNCATYSTSIEPEIKPENMECSGTFDRHYKWSVVDDCGNYAEVTKIYHVSDSTPPKFTTKIPRELKATCKHASAPILDAVDNCGLVTISGPDEYKKNLSQYGNICDFNYELYREWTAVDECGLNTTVSQTVRVSDGGPPVLVGSPPDMTMSCDSELDFQNIRVTAIDDCCVNEVEFTGSFQRYDVVCAHTYKIVNRWSVSDCCGHDVDHLQTVSVYDDTPPRIIGVPGSRYVEIHRLGSIPSPSVTAEDACDPMVTVQFSEVTKPGSCEHNYIIIKMWNAVDDCGNKAVSLSTIRCNDNTPPEFEEQNYNSAFECPELSLPVVHATDNVGEYLVTLQEVKEIEEGSCQDSYKIFRHFTATDPCGNIAEKTYTVEIWDTTPPQWDNLPCQSEFYTVIDTKEAYSGLCVDDVKASDLCAGEILVQFDSVTNAGTCETEYIVFRRYTATDHCGNFIFTSRTTDVQDMSPPELVGIPPDTTLDCADDYAITYIAPTAVDYGYAGELDITVRLQLLSGQLCESNFTAVKCWSVTDCVGHVDKECQTITVRDTTPPTFGYLPPHTTINCESVTPQTVVTATDDCSSVVVVPEETRESGTCEDNYVIIRMWKATDICDLTRIYTQTVTVVDETNPTFDYVPSDELLPCGTYSRYVAATCVDNCDYKLDVSRSRHDVDGTCQENSMTVRKWICLDNCGNQAEAVQSISFEDNEPPTFNYEPVDLSLPCRKTSVIPSVPQIRALDNCDRQAKITFDEFIKPGNYGFQSSENIRIWTATDSCGNTVDMQQTIVVYDDIPPSVDVPMSKAYDCTEDYSFPNYTQVKDNCDDNPVVDMQKTSPYSDCHDKYTLEFAWTPCDKSGNCGITRTSRITVDDSTPPSWNLPLPDTYVKVSYTESSPPQVLTADDICDETPKVVRTDVVIEGDCPLEQTAIYSYTATDRCGNGAIFIQTVVTYDDIPPTMSPLPTDTTINCPAEFPSPPEVFNNDHYAYESYPVVFTEREEPGTCENEKILIRQWITRDCAANYLEHIQTLSILDNIPPVLPSPRDKTFECAPDDYTVLEATDECDLYVNVEFTEDQTLQDCVNRSVSRQWVATDSCGNSDTVHQLVTILDRNPPELYGQPLDTTVDNHNVPSGGYELSCSDACQSDLWIASFSDHKLPGSCEHAWETTQTWVCTDNCGHETTVSRVISVQDVEPPSFNYCPSDMTVQLGLVPAPPTLTAVDGQVYDEVQVQYTSEESTEYIGELQSIIYRTWRAVDECFNEVVCEQTISVIDTVPPIIPDVPRDAHVDCKDPIIVNWEEEYKKISLKLIESVVDVGTVQITPGAHGPYPLERIPGTCRNDYTVKRTWTATDHAGNSLSDTQVITVFDDHPPVFKPINTTINAECTHHPEPAVSVSDNCDEVYPLFHENINPGYCPEEYELIRTWNVQDLCGNKASLHQTVFVTDDKDPTVDNPPSDMTLECTSYLSLPIPETLQCHDNCLGDYPATYSSEKHPYTCEDSWLIVRSWSCKDSCYGEVLRTQTITLEDRTSPVFQYITFPDITIECDEVAPVIEVSATDDCAKYVSIHHENLGYTTDYSTMQFEQLWIAVDNCGNRKNKTRLVFIEDTHLPKIDVKAPDQTIPCDQYYNYELPEPHCLDNCGVPTIERTLFTKEGSCENEYDVIVNWTCTDLHDLKNFYDMTLTVVDDTPPTIDIKNIRQRIPCVEPVPPAPKGNAYDNCDTVTVEFDETKEYPNYVQQSFADPPNFSIISTRDQSTYYSYYSEVQVFSYFPIPIDIIRPYKMLEVRGGSIINQLMDNCKWRCFWDEDCVIAQLYAPVAGQRRYCYLYNLKAGQEIIQEAYKVPVTQSPITLDGIGLWLIKSPNYPDNRKVVDFEFTPTPYHLCDDFVVTRTWKSADVCGNEVQKSHVFTVYDDVRPEFTYIPDDITYDCTESSYQPSNSSVFESSQHGVNPPTVVDNCDSRPKIEESFESIQGQCQSNIMYYIRWVATDSCGHEANAYMTITKSDSTAPSMAYVTSEEDIECTKDMVPPSYPSCTDDCSEVTVVKTKKDLGTTCNYQSTYVWTCTDECGNGVSASQIMHITDTLPPTISGLPEDATVDCAHTYVVPEPSVADDCGNSHVSSTINSVTLGCFQSKLHIVTWVASDDCGNKATESVTVTYLDTTPPSIFNVPESSTAECETEYIDAGVTASDDCGDVVLKFSESTQEYDCVTTGMYYSVYRTWVALDTCGHDTVRTQTVTVTDNQPPTISVPGDLTIPCNTVQIPHINAVAADNCGIVSLESSTETKSGTCEDEHSVITTFTATDNCGYVYHSDHTTYVEDQASPVLTGIPGDRTVECDEIPDIPSVQSNDDCGYPTPHFDESSTRDGYSGQEYEIIRCWWIADLCGNRVDGCYTLTVQDTRPPELYCAGMTVCESISIECAIYPPLPPVTVHDNCYEHLEIKYNSSIDTGTCVHDHTEYREWSTNDAAGGYDVLTQTVNYYDLTPPKLEGYTGDTTIECPDVAPVPVVTANDNCDYALDVEYTHSRIQNDCKSVYVENRKWTATDICGNTDWLAQYVAIVDTSPPVLSIYSSDATVQCDQIASTWPGSVSAADDCDYDVFVKFTEEKKDGTCADEYTLIRTWRAVDCEGNPVSHVQTVKVLDSIPPYFGRNAPEDETIDTEDIYSRKISLEDPYAFDAHDNCAYPSIKFEEVTVPLGYDCEYMYYRIRSWNIHDDCGNTDQYQQTIEMVYTAIPQLEDPEDITVECDSVPVPCDVKVLGDNSYDVSVNYNEETVLGTCPQEYELIRSWTGTDCAYNSAEVFQTVTVVDGDAPVFTRYPEDITVECECDSLTIPVVDAVDNCDLSGEEVKLLEIVKPGTCKHNYLVIRTWEATDTCGNKQEWSQYVSVEDTQPPLFCDDFCDEDFVDSYGDLECDRVMSSPDPLVKDDCDEKPHVVSGESEFEFQQCEDEITWTWEATDKCGNKDSCTRVIDVVDSTAPSCVNCDMLCYPVNDYGTSMQYAVYKVKNMIEVVDNCNESPPDPQILSCNSTQHNTQPNAPSYDTENCVFFPDLDRLYVKLEADATPVQGRYYYVWFSITDGCDNFEIVKKTIWIPTNPYSYYDAIAAGHCSGGIGTDDFKSALLM